MRARHPNFLLQSVDVVPATFLHGSPRRPKCRPAVFPKLALSRSPPVLGVFAPIVNRSDGSSGVTEPILFSNLVHASRVEDTRGRRRGFRVSTPTNRHPQSPGSKNLGRK